MSFGECLQRAELVSLENFLLLGGESSEKTVDKSYKERLKQGERKLRDFLHNQYPDTEIYEAVSQHFNEMANVIEEVYFEIGLLMGAKIGYQLRGKMDELSGV